MKSYTQIHTVKSTETAIEMGSGSLEVYATPAMVALMESCATKVLGTLPNDTTTVGISINVLHQKASKIGDTVTCTATLIKNEGRTYDFEIVVTNKGNEIIGTANHSRVTVKIERFLEKL